MSWPNFKNTRSERDNAPKIAKYELARQYSAVRCSVRGDFSIVSPLSVPSTTLFVFSCDCRCCCCVLRSIHVPSHHHVLVTFNLLLTATKMDTSSDEDTARQDFAPSTLPQGPPIVIGGQAPCADPSREPHL